MKSESVFQNYAAFAGVRFELCWIYHGPLEPAAAANQSGDWANPWPVPFSVFFVEAGHIALRMGEQELLCHKGDCFLGAPGYRQHRASAATRLLSIGFRLCGSDGHDLVLHGLNRRLSSKKSNALYLQTRRLLRAVHPKQKEIAWTRSVQWERKSFDLIESTGLATSLLLWLRAYVEVVRSFQADSSEHEANDTRIAAAVVILDRWPLDEKVPREMICRQTGLSWRRLEQLFAEHLKISPHAYFERLRLARAQERLKHSELMLKEISFELGFRHTSHFSSWFRKHTSTSPRSFRSQTAAPWRDFPLHPRFEDSLSSKQT